MQFNVEISELAEEQYDNILDYLANVKKNPQAVNGVIDDFDYAVEQLEKMADTFGRCQDKRLSAMGFHKLHFKAHRYLFVYRINGNRVIIEGMYHELQDYENAIG
ncbi:MAG: type II toxin-antitoxin system RelE/ParE family toxin [Lachnospiraceae bacterium]|nr:type II toxin-antitoxin system RelE/ParE family toxin [Lachnospiraceae bacterium]MDO4966955.1 type II toxin-antitoxin system RelE/ParE family toxin [Lachnospiraceae bacterium]